jgi:hypothetical protein
MSGAVYNGYIYSIGGLLSSTYYSDVQYAQLNVIARTGHYSKLITLTDGSLMQSLSLNGSFSAASSVHYRIAGSDGVFGQSYDSSHVQAGGGSTCSTSSGDKYVWISVDFDDSQQAVFPYTSASNISDVTVNYQAAGIAHPPVDFRLHGGKWFKSEALQPLDTCGP